MLRLGRGNWIILALVAAVLAIVGLVSFSGETPTKAAQRFMAALGRGDAEVLADMSYFDPPIPREEAVKQWRYSLDIGKHYNFAWRFINDSRPSPKRATVRMGFVKDAEREMAYEENFPLELVRVNDRWLVDVRTISREMYPALPR